MPIYEYKCKECGNEFEVIQKFSDKPVKKCPDCSGKVEKLISQSSFVLKGTGWYQTDFADKKKDVKGKKETKETKETKDTKEAKDTKDTKEKAEPPTPDCSSCPSC